MCLYVRFNLPLIKKLRSFLKYLFFHLGHSIKQDQDECLVSMQSLLKQTQKGGHTKQNKTKFKKKKFLNQLL